MNFSCKACGMGLIGWVKDRPGFINIGLPNRLEMKDTGGKIVTCICPCGLRWEQGEEFTYEILAGDFNSDFYVAMCDMEDPHGDNSAEKKFWYAIWDSYLRDPDDPTALLVFAHWLEEKDDPRGELIQLSVEAYGGQERPPGEYYPVYRHYIVLGRCYRLRKELGYQHRFNNEQNQLVANGTWLLAMERKQSAIMTPQEAQPVFQEMVELGIPQRNIDVGRQEAARIYSRILQKQGKGP